MKRTVSKLIRGMVIGFLLADLSFGSWLINPAISPLSLLAKPAFAQGTETDNEGESEELDETQPSQEELNNPAVFDRVGYEIGRAVELMAQPLIREGRLILDPRDGAILRAYLEPDTFASQTAGIDEADQEVFDEIKNKLGDVRSLLSSEQGKQKILEAVRTAQNKVLTDRSRVALVTLERLVEENRDPQEIGDFFESVIEPGSLPGETLIKQTKQQFPLDRRVIDTLAWLIKPRTEGGAGHERLRIARIWKNYTSKDREKNKSRETEDANNESAHARGQALDISEIETVKCSKVIVKKGVIRRKVTRTKIPPKPIKVSYQTDQGVAQEQPPSLSFNSLIQDLLQTSLLDTLSEFDLTDLGEEGELRSAGLQDLADFVGRTLLESLLGGKGLEGFSLRETVELFGRAVLADRLGLPRAAIEGNTVDEIESSVGRFSLEERLHLPVGSLRGSNAQEILRSVGRRKIEAELSLKDRSLQGSWNSRQSLEEKLGQAMIETKLKMPVGRFGSNNLTELKQQLGERKFQLLFASSPAAIDELVGLPAGKTATLLLSGNVAGYKREIGAKAIDDNFGIYREFEENQSKRDEAYGTRPGLVQRLLGGDQSVFPLIGVDTLLPKLSSHDDDQARLRSFFDNPALELAIPERTVMSFTGLRPNEFARIFSGSGASAIYRRLGRNRIVQAVRNTPEVQRAISQKEQELYAEHPEILEAKASFEFRRAKFQELEHHINNLESLVRSATADPQARVQLTTIKTAINEILRQPLNFRGISNGLKRISQALDQLSSIVGPLNQVTLRRQIEDELATAYQLIEEIITGDPTQSYRDIRPGDVAVGPTGRRGGGSLISTRDLLDFLGGRRSAKDFLLSLGARQVENSLELPALSIFYALQERQQTPETFFRSIGRAHYEAVFGNQPIALAIAQHGPSNIDNLLRIGTGRRSITDRLSRNEITRDQYFEKVGKEVLLARGVNLLGIGQLEIAGLQFTPYDIYDILTGNGRTVFERVAALKFGEVFGVPQTVFWQLFRSQSGDDRRLALAETASYFLGRLAGIGPLPVFGVPEELGGRQLVESRLGLASGSFKNSLDKVIQINGPVNFALAFRMVGHENGLPLPGYDPQKFNEALTILAIPQTLTNVFAQTQASNYLSSLASGAEDIIRRFQQGTVSNEQLELTVEQVDELLRLEIGTTEKFLRGQLSVADYGRRVGGFSLAQNLANAPGILSLVADTLGLEGEMRAAFELHFPRVFQILNANKVKNIVDWNPADRQDLFLALDQLIGIRFDDKLGVRQGTFALIASEPHNARQILLTEGIFKIDRELNLSGSLERTFNVYINADQALRSRAAIEQAEGEVILLAQREIFDRTLDKNGTGGVLVPEADLRLLARGDLRYIPLIAAADMVGSLNKDRDGFNMPAEYQITYQVIVDAFRGPQSDGRSIEEIGTTEYLTARDRYPGSDEEGRERFAREAQQEAMERKRGELRSNRKKELQYRLIDNQLYKFDINIPVGFARAMLDGTTQQRTLLLKSYVEQVITNRNLLGVPIPPGSLDALEQYIRDPNSQENYDRLIRVGVLSSFDQFIVDKQLFGGLWQPGTAQALFHYARTGQLGNVNTPGTLVGIYGQWAVVQVFRFFDEKMGWQVGSAAQIYFAAQNFLAAKAAFEAAKLAHPFAAFGGVSQEMQQARTQMNEAYAAMISIVVSIVFAKQIAGVERAIGLVPGTGAILIGMGISALMGAAINPITIGLFILLNLFGFNRVKIFVLCTGDGYYPQIEPVNPELTIGLSEFNGMSVSEYRQGLKQSAQQRVNGLISDMMEMGYYFVDKEFVGTRQPKPDRNTKPIQILTARQEDLLAFFGTVRYKQVFNADAPSKNNRQGISISPKVSEYVHIGF